MYQLTIVISLRTEPTSNPGPHYESRAKRWPLDTRDDLEGVGGEWDFTEIGLGEIEVGYLFESKGKATKAKALANNLLSKFGIQGKASFNKVEDEV